MITSLVLNTYFNILRNKLTGFPLFSEFVYAPDLAFDPKVREYIVKSDVNFKSTTGLDNWVAVVWNRELAKKSVYQSRRFNLSNKSGNVADLGDARLVDISLNLNYISTSLTLLEGFEEIFIPTDNNIDFDVNLGERGYVTASVNNFELISLTKESNETLGSLVTLSTSQSITYPLIYFGNVDNSSLITGLQGTSLDIFNNIAITDQIKVVTTDSTLVGKLLTMYVIKNNILVSVPVILSTTGIIIDNVTNVLAIMCVQSGTNVTITNAEGTKQVWSHPVVTNKLYGGLAENTVAKNQQLRISSSVNVTGYVGIIGTDSTNSTIFEVLYLNNRNSIYTQNKYITLNYLLIGDIATICQWTVEVLGTVNRSLISQINFDIYNNGIKLEEVVV